MRVGKLMAVSYVPPNEEPPRTSKCSALGRARGRRAAIGEDAADLVGEQDAADRGAKRRRHTRSRGGRQKVAPQRCTATTATRVRACQPITAERAGARAEDRVYLHCG